MNYDLKRNTKTTTNNKTTKKRTFRGRHKRCETHVPLEELGFSYVQEQIVQQHDMLLAEIVRSKIEKDEKLRLMRDLCRIYGLDEQYANDYYANYVVEHNGALMPNAADTAFDLVLEAFGLLKKACSDNPQTVKRVEATMVAAWAVFQLRRDMNAVLLHLVQYIISISSGPIIEPLLGCLKQIFITTGEQSNFDHLESGIHEEYGHVFKNLSKQPFVTHARTIASLLCTIGLVDPKKWHVRGFELFTLQAFDDKKLTMLDILDSTLGAVTFFFDRGYQCFIKQNLRPLFVVSDYMMELEIELETLSIKVKNHVQGSARCEFADLNTEIYRLADKIRASLLTVKPIEAVVLRRLMRVLLSLENDVILAFKSQTTRIAPYCVKIWGYSGVGKTSFNLLTMREILRYNEYPYADVNISKIEPEKEYWENIKNDTTGIVIDDMCNTKHTKEKVNPADILIKVVNNQPQSVNRADIADKGKIWLDAKVVGITTNNRTLAAEHWSVEPMSVVRRCHLHIDLSVKAEYADENGQLDQSKAEDAEKCGYIQDLWVINVWKIGIQNHSLTTAQGYKLIPAEDARGPLLDIGIERYLKFIYKETAQYYCHQRKYIEAQRLENNVVTECAVCRLPENWCKCCHNIASETLDGFDDISLDDSNTEQNGYAAFFMEQYFMHAMSIINASIFAYWYSWSQNYGAHYIMRILTFFQSAIFPTWWEKCVIDGLLKHETDMWMKGAIYWINRFIDFNYIFLPSWITNSPYSTYLYFYWYRQSIYSLIKSALTSLLLGCCVAHCLCMWYEGFIIAEFQWFLLCVHIGCVTCTTWLKYCYSIQIIAQLHTWLTRFLMCHWFSLAIRFSFLQHRHYSWKQCVFIFICVMAFLVIQVSVAYMKIYLRLQNLRAIGAKSTFHTWTYSQYTTSAADFFSTTGLAHNIGVFVIIINTIRIIRLGLKLYTATEAKVEDENGGVLSPCTVEAAEMREVKNNIWAHTIQSTTKTSRTCLDFVNTCKKNLLLIKITSTTKDGITTPSSTYCNAIMLTGGVVLLPLHMVHKRTDTLWEYMYDTCDVTFVRSTTPNTGWKETLHMSQGHIIPKHDLILFPVYGGGQFKSITQHFAKRQDYNGGIVRTLHRGLSGDFNVASGRVVLQGDIHYKRINTNFQWTGLHVKRSCEWVRGDCMTMIISDDSNPQIVGLHLMGTGDLTIGISVTISQEIMITALSSLSDAFILHSAEDLELNLYGIDIQFDSNVHIKSPVNHIEERNVTVLGTVSGGVTPNTAVRDSIAVPFLSNELGPQLYGPPRFKGFSGRESWLPWYTNLNGTSRVGTNVPHAHLTRAILDYQAHLYDIIMLHSNKVRPLTEEQTINGFKGSRFMTPLNFHTSMGYPINKPKITYMRVANVDEDGHKIYEFIERTYWDRWYYMEEELANNRTPTSFFKATLKDEATKLTKEKVRVFQAADIGMQLGVRKYFLPIIRVMCLHPLITECAVGINPFSREWDALHEHVTKFGDHRIIAGDYKGWDTTLPAVLVYRAMLVLVEFAKWTNHYTERDLRVMRGLAAMLCNPLINFNGTALKLHGTTPSGHNLTSILNSICNSLLLRCAFYRKPSRHSLEFRLHVSVITYGDDFVAGVIESTDFSLVEYESYLAHNTGIVVTMPDKTSSILPYMNFSSVDFLKRKSVYIEELQAHIGVLSLQSIHKSLYTTVAASGNERLVLIAVVQSALHELFFHGRSVYDQYTDIFQRMFLSLDIIPGDIYRTFEERVLDWQNSYNEQVVLDDGQVEDTLAASSPVLDTLSTECVAPFNDLSHVIIEDKQRLTEHIILNDSEGNTITPGVRTPSMFVEHSGIITEKETSHSALIHLDTINSWSQGLRSARDATFNIIHDSEGDITDSFKRPVIIQSVTWPMQDKIDLSIDLLGAWIKSSAVVQNRLRYYRYLSGTMCCKVTVNGSPFMYGKSILAAQYWPAIPNDGKLLLPQLTSLPHVSITPTDGTAGCLSIPLFHPNGAIDLLEKTEPVRLLLNSITPLRSVQESSESANITIWAWFEDYKLTTPTRFVYDPLWEQSGDEYSRPLVSTTATALSQYIGRLGNWPVIGPYARASELAVGTAGAIAQLFGYSKPSKLQTAAHVQHTPVGNLSNFNGEDTAVKLALDIKQEVTIDPAVTGYGGEDDMIINRMAQRESYLTAFFWDARNTNGTTLWRCVVNPGVAGQDRTGLPFFEPTQTIIPTPLAYTSYPFQHWRGSIVYRFEVVASPFHKGKLRFVHEPAHALSGSGAWSQDTSLLPSHIIDLSITRDLTMVVPWTNSANYLEVASPTDEKAPMWSYDSNDTLSQQPMKYNGVIGVSVVDPLTCFDSDDIFVLVYVKAGDDFELQTPIDTYLRTFHTFTDPSLVEQGGDFGLELKQAPANTDIGETVIGDATMKHTVVDKLAQIHFGERVVSIRQLVKRYCHSLILVPEVRLNDYLQYQWRLPDFPPYPGFDPIGTNRTAAGPFVYASPANFLTYFTPCFLMRRGSLRSKYIVGDFDKSFSIKALNISASRSQERGYTASYSLYTPDVDSTTTALSYLTANHSLAMNGTEISQIPFRNVVDVETPFYSPQRWYFAQDRKVLSSYDPLNATATQKMRNQTFHTITLDANTRDASTDIPNSLNIRRYTSAGDDFSLHYYMYPPLLYVVPLSTYPPGPT